MEPNIAELIERRFGMPAEAGRAWPATGTIAAMLAHRVHRRYTGAAIAEDTMQVLLAAALSAPSKSDLQQASVIRVRDAGLRREIDALTPGMPWVAEAPEYLVFCGDNRRHRQVAALRGKPFPNDTLDMFMNAAVDAGLVMQSFIIAAESVGLGCCPISLIRNPIERLGALLALPPGVFPVAGLCVGHPAEAGRLSMRLPPAVTVHTDRYDASGFEAELAAYDARRAAAEPPPRQKYVERFGEVTPYTWSEDKARQYAVPERHAFGDWVRRQGFALR
ncbi:MAG: nitroreductase family protein [Burkholderiales bacterium]|nr:nitroreductase family protein [Burkholderiales bacterium]